MRRVHDMQARVEESAAHVSTEGRRGWKGVAGGGREVTREEGRRKGVWSRPIT